MESTQLSKDPRYKRLCELLNTGTALGATLSLLNWDQRVKMPAAAVEERAEQLSVVAGLHHEHSTADELGLLLDQLTEEYGAEGLDDEVSLLRVAAREYERARRLPAEYVRRRTAATVRAKGAWEQARDDADFALFREHLKRLVAMVVEETELLGYDAEPYDALLEKYEPGTPTATVRRILGELRQVVQPIADESPVEGEDVVPPWQRLHFEGEKQLDFGRRLLGAIGFDPDRGRLDLSAHPFCTSLNPNDVRLTTRIKDTGLGLWSTLHEGGHGIHGQGRPEHFFGTPLWPSPSLGISESQSRLFENVVGRSRDFWSHHYPDLQQLFPEQLGQVSLDAFVTGINQIRRSFIRTAADEVTYHLHILLRFELEVQLVEEKLAVEHLPAAWNAKMEEYLGITPADDAQGVLQDTHWAGAAFGYFPTYSLGSVLACQLWEMAADSDPQVVEERRQGSCAALIHWLQENVYAYGAKLPPLQLVETVTGEPLAVEPFAAYVKQKWGEG